MKPGRRWWSASLDPRKAYQRDGIGFVTNGHGVGFSLHKGTRPEEIESVVDYLDRLERALDPATLARIYEQAHEAEREIRQRWQRDRERSRRRRSAR